MDETSESLIAAAHRLLGEIGPEALTVRRIATEASMSTMNVYSRFGGKDGVIEALYIDGYRRLTEAIAQVPAGDDVPSDLVRVASVFREWAMANRAYYGVMFKNKVPGFEPSSDAVEVAYQALAHLVERVRHGQELGQITATDGRSPVEIAAWLWATCHGMISLELDGTGEEFVSWPSIFDMGIRTAIAGLHPSAASAPIA